MAAPKQSLNRQVVVKRTSQGGKAKTSSMNKTKRRAYKAYRGQGK